MSRPAGISARLPSSAVNIDVMMPRLSTTANPLTGPVPNTNSTTPAMSVVMLPSKIDEKDAIKSMQRMAEGKFDFYDFLDQMKMIQNLGPLEGLLGLMPGFSKIKKQLPAGAFDNKKIKRTEAIVLSMTLIERQRPEIIKGSRRQRIAAGSGTTLMEVNQLIKQFGEMRKMMKSPHKMKNMMKQMGGAGGMKDMMKGLGGGKFPF